jgi:hypothetical protein
MPWHSMVVGRVAYNLVLHKRGLMLYNGVTHCIVEQMTLVAANVSATHDSNLVATVCSEWDRQKTFMRSIDDVLMYLVGWA